MREKPRGTNAGQRKRRMSQEERRRQVLQRTAILGAGILAAVTAVIIAANILKPAVLTGNRQMEQEYRIGNPTMQVAQPDLDVQLLTVNEYSRPGTATDGIKGIVVHYTANPGSSAQDNRDYFENLKDTHDTKVSSNFIVGIDGEIIQCIPTNEVAYASNERNQDTVSIECCHLDESGEFTEATYDSLVRLVSFLCGKFNLGMDDVIRHYDVTGKNCPKYFVENEDKWQAFKADVAEYIEKNGE